MCDWYTLCEGWSKFRIGWCLVGCVLSYSINNLSYEEPQSYTITFWGPFFQSASSSQISTSAASCRLKAVRLLGNVRNIWKAQQTSRSRAQRVYCTLLIFYIIGSLYRIQVDESNLPVAFLKVAPGAVFLRQFSVLGLHLASNSLWFDPDLWTCFGLAFRENSLSHLKCAINHPTGYNGPSQNFFEHGSVHDNDNDTQCLKKQSLKRIGLNCLKRNIWVFPKIWGSIQKKAFPL